MSRSPIETPARHLSPVTRHLLAFCCLLATLYCLLAASAAHAACANPAGAEGQMVYNKDWRTVQYCNGAAWVAAGPRIYNPTAVQFDGTNDYLSALAATLQGEADSDDVTGSFWIRRNGGNGTKQVIYSNTGPRFEISLDTSDRIRIQGGSTNSTNRIVAFATAPAITDTNWHHVAFSFDLDDTNKRAIYIDGAAATASWTTYSGSSNIDFTVAAWSVGANTGGTEKFNGDLADFWMEVNNYYDLSNAANLRTFITADGKPVWLGANGSLGPSGAAPDLFFSGPLATWESNDGSAAGFTENGALTASPYMIMEAGYSGIGGGGANVTSGLIGHWMLDESGNVSTAADSINGNTGTLTGFPADPTASWIAAGRLGGALDFDGSNDFINVGDITQTDNLTAITVSAWINPDGLPAGIETSIVAKYDAAGGSGGKQFSLHYGYPGGTGICLAHDGWADNCSWGGDGTAPDGVWTHVLGTYDGAVRKFYVNGILLDSDNDASGITATSGEPLYIGKRRNSDLSWVQEFNGRIDDVRIYNRALTSSEVVELYLWGGGSCTNPDGAAGQIMHNADEDVMQYCEGRNWRPMGPVPGAGGAGGCSLPGGDAGGLVYNPAESVMQYCDGANWIALGGGIPLPPSAGLVGHWKLDESAGNPADSSGNGHTGSLSGNPVWQPTGGKVGGAIALDGTGDAIWSPNPFNGLTAGVDDFTFTLWFKTSETNQEPLIGWSPYRWCALVIPSNGRIGCTVTGDAFASGLWSNTVVNDNNWHHLAWTYAADQTQRIYIDGVLEDETNTEAIGSTADAVSVGTRPFNPSNGAQAVVDDFRIYNRALSPAEVQRLYETTGGQ